MYPRLLAPYLGEYTGATVVIRNMPGAGGLVGLNKVYSAEPDGLTIVIHCGPVFIMAQLLGAEGVRYDCMEMEWLGRLNYSPAVVLVDEEGPYQTIEDLQAAKEVRAPSTGMLDNYTWTALMFAHAFNINCKPVLGYPSGPEAALAIKRGEADMMAGVSEDSALNYMDGFLVPLCILDREGGTILKDVPTVYELVSLTKDQEWWFDLLPSIYGIKRIVLAPPGVPKERVEFLRDAIEWTLSNKDLLAAAEKTGRPMNYLSGEETRACAAEVLEKTTKEQIEKIRYVVLEKYFE